MLALTGAGFLAANPYALLDARAFWEGIRKQTETAGDEGGKLGLANTSGWWYYLTTYTWGFGWLPSVAALGGLGDVLDGSAAEPHARGVAVLSAVALPFVLLATAVRAPLLADGPPPVIGVTAVVAALAIFAVQALVSATAAMPRSRVRASAVRD
jgi:hypothetical protein